ncbi:MAG: PAC2 family protein [Ilumatobacteraceae bacterium]|nr:PAC2 family protein [Acidimicrobiales bacterium]MCB9395803.1 PAC2 family protein [Acidimicrobiaceae bacterium]
MEHLRWLAQPTLHRPTVIAAFTGWNDGGDAASNAVRHLVESWGAQPLAEIDPEEFTDFATVRPHVRLADGATRSIVWPTVAAWSASTPGGDVILVLGPEPALRWRTFTQQVLGLAQRFGAGLVVTLGALLADVPHTRPVQLIGTATDGHLISRFDLQRSRYEGPTGIVGVLHDACTSAGLDSVSLWAAVPAYASQVPSPKAALALVSRACGIIGSPTPVGRLSHEAAEYEQRVSSLVRDDDDLVGYVARLETLDLDDDDDDDVDDTIGGELADDDLPGERLAPIDPASVDSDELMAEVERFLRDQPDD